MAKIFKYTLKHNLLSLPFLVSAALMLAAGGYEAFIYIAEYYYMEFQLSQVLDDRIPQFMTLLFAVLPCLTTGRELANGTVRNKIISGTSKSGFFVAHLLVNCLMTVMLVVLYFLPKFIFCMRFFKHFDGRFLLLAIMCMCLGYILITAVGTVVSVMSDKMAVSIVVSLSLLFIALFCYNWIDRRLGEPMVDTEGWYETDDDGEEVYGVKEVTNPHYIESNTVRKTLWTVQHLLPAEVIENGHMMISEKITNMKVFKDTSEVPKAYTSIRERHDYLFHVPIYSICTTVAVSLLGLILFKRRNLK